MKLRNRSFFFSFGLCLLAHTSSVNGKELTEVNRVVAKVNDRFVTWGEINQAMDRLNFSESEKKQRAQEFVDGKIDRLLSIFAFTEKGMAIPESFIEQEYNKRLIRDFNGDRKLFRDVLRGNGQSQLEFRDELREEIIYGHMLATSKGMKEEISPEKVEEYYRKNAIQFKTEAKMQLSEIALTQIADEPQQVLLQQGRKLRADIEAGSPFEKVASENGQSPFRNNGGNWGVFVSQREIRSEELRDVASSLKKGEVSKPFLVDILERKPDGSVGKSGKVAVYILKVIDLKPAGVKPLDEVRNEIERSLISEIEQESQRKWLTQLKEDAYINVSLPK